MLIVEFVFMQLANIFGEYSHKQNKDGDLSNYSEINFSQGTNYVHVWWQSTLPLKN